MFAERVNVVLGWSAEGHWLFRNLVAGLSSRMVIKGFMWLRVGRNATDTNAPNQPRGDRADFYRYRVASRYFTVVSLATEYYRYRYRAARAVPKAIYAYSLSKHGMNCNAIRGQHKTRRGTRIYNERRRGWVCTLTPVLLTPVSPSRGRELLKRNGISSGRRR